ncbi:MAG: hypothetical protein WCN97_04995 [Thermoleophilia bacterium]
MRTRITPSLVLSIIAVVLSLTGVGYAATQLPRDSVGSAQIRDEAVQSSDIKAGAVGSSELAAGAVDGEKIKSGSIQLSDLSKGALKGLDGKDGAQGPAGPAGPTGPAGASGSGGGGGLTVTDAHGTTVGTLLFDNYPSSVEVVTPDGRFAYYESRGGGLRLRSQISDIISLDPSCAGPLYMRTGQLANLPRGQVFLGWQSGEAAFTAGDVTISPAHTTNVYAVNADGTCEAGVPGDHWDSPSTFTRLESTTAVTTIYKPLTYH